MINIIRLILVCELTPQMLFGSPKACEQQAEKTYKQFVDDYKNVTDDRTSEVYEHLLPGFRELAISLRLDQIWTDFGPGQCKAIDDYFKMGNFVARIQAVGKTGFHDVIGRYSHPDVYQRLKLLQNQGRFAPIFDIYLERLIPALQLTTDLGTDVFGPFSYSLHPDKVVNNYLRYLKVGGILKIVANDKDLFGQSKTDFGPWLNKFKGIEWTQEISSKDPTGRGGRFPLVSLTLKRVALELFVPRLKVVKYQLDEFYKIPIRTYEVELEETEAE